MASWSDVRTYLEEGVPLPLIPDGMELVPVAGVSFVDRYPTNLRELAKAHAARTGDMLVQLIRNPENAYDSNAVEVRLNDVMLGHLPRAVAAEVAPTMDQGHRYVATVFQVRISPDNPSQPGLDILMSGPQ